MKKIKLSSVKSYVKGIILSVMVVIFIPVVAYMLQEKWFMYVGVPFFLIFIWLMEIMQFETPLDKKAYKEAINMLGKKKVLMNELEVPTPPKPPIDMANRESIDDNVFVNKLKVLKVELGLIDNKISEVEKEKESLIYEYNDLVRGLNLKISGLEGSKKEIKEKMLELI